MDSMAYYKGMGYGIINKTLREAVGGIPKPFVYDQNDGYILKHIHRIDDKTTSKSEEGFEVFRGLHHHLSKYIEDGNTWFDEFAYTSTSENIETAYKFSDKCCILRINVPEDVGFYVYHCRREPEILLERNLRVENVVFSGDLFEKKKIYDSTLRHLDLDEIHNHNTYARQDVLLNLEGMTLE